MSKDTKINLVLTAWWALGLWATHAVYELALPWGVKDAILTAGFPAIPTIALAIVLSFRLSK
jgi:hypothetical protein